MIKTNFTTQTDILIPASNDDTGYPGLVAKRTEMKMPKGAIGLLVVQGENCYLHYAARDVRQVTFHEMGQLILTHKIHLHAVV
jgi:hypothetical protein